MKRLENTDWLQLFLKGPTLRLVYVLSVTHVPLTCVKQAVYCFISIGKLISVVATLEDILYTWCCVVLFTEHGNVDLLQV